MTIRVFHEDVDAMFDEAIERLGETKGALAAAGDLVLKANKAKWGQRWKPSAPGTIEKKGGGEPGVESGKLKAAMTEPGAPGQIHELTPTSLKIGIGNEPLYPDRGNAPAYTFEAGGRFPRVKGQKGRSAFLRQPKRRLMWMTPAVMKAISAELAKRLLPPP